MFRRQKFAVAGVVTISKAAAKAAEKIKKINKKDMEKFGASFSKMKRMLEKMNQPAVDAYKKTIKQIKSRITKGKSKEDMKDMQDAADILNKKLFKGSKDLVKRYESLPDVRSRFRGAPGRQRKLVKGVTNPMKRAEILQKDRLKRFKEEGLPEMKKYKRGKFRGN